MEPARGVGHLPTARPPGAGQRGRLHSRPADEPPRGPAGQATRRYLLAGLLRCGTCGRRLESTWSNGRPAYRCRHGYTSATQPDPSRPKNTYVRQDQITPHLAALAILLASHEHPPRLAGQITGPAQAAELIDRLRATGRTLTFSPQHRTLGVDTEDAVAITIGHRH